MTDLPRDLLLQHAAIVGKTGAGKTFAGKGMVENLLDERRRVCVLDPTGAWWGLRLGRDGKKDGYAVLIFGGERADVPLGERSGKALASFVAGHDNPVIADLSEMTIGERHRFATDFAGEIYRLNRRPLHLVVDEADEFMPQNPLPETKRMLHQFDRIVRRGRIKGFRVLMITQRPAVLHKNVLTQANALIALRLTSPQDRAALKAWIEGQADVDQGKEVIASLPKLQRGEGWVWAPEIDKLFTMKFPQIRTFDSSRAPDYDEEAPEISLGAVDLDDVRAAFDEAVAEAEANDPKALRRRIAELEREIAKKPAPGASAAEINAARQDGFREGVAEALSSASKQVASLAATLGAGVPERQPGPAPAPKPVERPSAPARAPVARQQPPHQTNGSLSRPQQRVLDALAWFEAVGENAPSKTACAFVAGYTAGSGAINNLFGQLRSLGYIDYPVSKSVSLTAAGRALAHVVDAPPTSAALQDMVKAQLPAPMARVLTAAIADYPDPISKPELAERSGYTPGAGAFNNYCGRLRSLKLIEYPTSGQVRACDILFIQ